MDVSILRGRASEAREAPIGWKHPYKGFLLLLGSSIADDVAHYTKEGSITRAHEGIKCYPR